MKTFSEFQEGVVALKVGSKLLPKLMVAAGLAGTLMQIKKRVPKNKTKTADIARLSKKPPIKLVKEKSAIFVFAKLTAFFAISTTKLILYNVL